MDSIEQTITDFYTAFSKKDYRGMQECYHKDIQFSDAVFQNLKGGEARAMWHMLANASKDLKVTFKNVKSNGTTGSADWDAWYSFSRTGRKVHNVIHGAFEFKDGKIIKHTDTFNLWKWTRMALGMSGTLLGWSSIVTSKIRGTARKNLDKFIAENAEYQA